MTLSSHVEPCFGKQHLPRVVRVSDRAAGSQRCPRAAKRAERACGSCSCGVQSVCFPWPFGHLPLPVLGTALLFWIVGSVSMT